MSRPTVVVVGAGPSGLGCAVELASRCTVTLVDRIPVPGGSAGWDDPQIATFTEQALSVGVQLRLGVSAIRWDGAQLVTAEPGRFDSLPADQLFVAGGLRPGTLADLNVTGDRPAGVVAGTVAEHLLQAGVRLWRTLVVVGDGPWASVVARRARQLGTRVVAVADHADWADERVDVPARWSIVGRDRVSGVRLYGDHGDVELPCDGVVLAGHPMPNRNIDGAVLDPAPAVTFVQPLSPHSVDGRFRAGRLVARTWVDHQRKEPQ